MKVFIALAALVAVSCGAPRYLVIPIEDVDFGNSNLRLPVYRMPAGLQGRQELLKRINIKSLILMLHPLLAMLTPPPLLLALTMLTMELTPVDMELSDGTPTIQSS